MSAALTVPIDDDTLARIDALADERSVSRDEILRFAILEFLEAQSEWDGELLPWQIEKVRLGLAAADRGEFATDEEVEQVFAKYGA